MHHAESFIINDKRQRTATFARAKRSIDKVLIAISHDAMDATQVQTTIVTATFPNTVTGLRWDLSFSQDGGTGLCEIVWAIVLAKEGNVADTMIKTNGVQFYEPEQNCLVFGTERIRDGVTQGQTKKTSGMTKTMRKMMLGDRIIFIIQGVATNTGSVQGVIQLFQKM